MARLDELPADQRAVLSLLLRRGKSYAEIADALDLPEGEVRERAHAALAALTPESAGRLSAAQRAQLADYVLSQQRPSERLIAYDELEGSPDARAWVNVLSGELVSLSGGKVPEVPTAPAARAGEAPAGPGAERAMEAPGTDEAPDAAPTEQAAKPAPEPPPPRLARTQALAAAPAPPPPAEPSQPDASQLLPAVKALPSSRLGGALLLAALVAAVVVAVVLATSSGSGGSTSSRHSSTAASSGTGATGTRSTGSQTGAAKPKVQKQLRLTPTAAGSSAVGLAEVVSESSQYAFILAAEHLTPSHGFFYAAWLYNAPSEAEALGKAPSVGSNGRLQPVVAPLPADAGKYHQLVVTRETSEHPSHPGPIVLSGQFSLH